jgi:hypothetical protein
MSQKVNRNPDFDPLETILNRPIRSRESMTPALECCEASTNYLLYLLSAVLYSGMRHYIKTIYLLYSTVSGETTADNPLHPIPSSKTTADSPLRSPLSVMTIL